jgi:hypothetical protein
MRDDFKENELSLKEIILFLKKYKKYFKELVIVLSLTTLFFSFIGYIDYSTASIEFESKATLLNEDATSNEQGGSIREMAIKAALSQNNEIQNQQSDDLYSLITNSNPFLLELAHKEIQISKNHKSIYSYFYNQSEEISLQKRILNKLKNSFKKPRIIQNQNSKNDTLLNFDFNQAFTSRAQIYFLSNEDKKIINILKSRIKLSQKGKLIFLLVKMPEAKLSAEVNKALIELLIKYTTRFKVAKQLENIKFLEERTKEAKEKYNYSQNKVASFKDNNFSLIFENIQTKQNNNQNEFNLYAGIYNQLILQLEQAKIQLKKDSPIFTFVEPIYIPDGKIMENAKISKFGAIGFFVGILIFSIILVFRNFLKL